MSSTDSDNDPLVLDAIAELMADEPTMPPATDEPSPQQAEMPFALVYGKAFTKLPEDLYIPPDALEVFLEAFEGPLDLLLYLIRRQNMDILDIQVAVITKQYMEYVEMMKAMRFELAAEYLLMAAMLGEIKSRCLLPRPKNEDGEEEEDPRAELIRRLQEYERYKKAALDLDGMPQEGREIFVASVAPPEYEREREHPHVDLREVLLALQEVLRRADLFESHHISKETLSLRERMTNVLEMLRDREFIPFVSLFTIEEGRLGVVVSFMAILELVKESLIELVQTEPFAPIHVKAKTASLDGSDELAEFEDDGAGDDAFESEPEELMAEEVDDLLSGEQDVSEATDGMSEDR